MNIKENLYNIMFSSLRFTIIFEEKGYLPKDKESAIRGSIGNMLFDSHCDSDRDCNNCDHKKSCDVQNFLYSPYIIKPDFVTTDESICYVIECNNKKTRCLKGDRLQFRILLFGQGINLVSSIINAIRKAGKHGLGKNLVKYSLESVYDRKDKPIYFDGALHKDSIVPEVLSDYISERRQTLSLDNKVTVHFVSPVTIKYQKQFIEAFSPEAVLESMARRIFMFNCFVGNKIDYPYIMVEDLPEVFTESSWRASVKRYSETKKKNMWLNGLMGYIEMFGLSQPLVDLVIACEVTHMGKNTSFGFGKIEVD